MNIFKRFKKKKKIVDSSFTGRSISVNPHPPIAIKRMLKRLETVDVILETMRKEHPKRDEFLQARLRLRKNLNLDK